MEDKPAQADAPQSPLRWSDDPVQAKMLEDHIAPLVEALVGACDANDIDLTIALGTTVQHPDTGASAVSIRGRHGKFRADSAGLHFIWELLTAQISLDQIRIVSPAQATVIDLVIDRLSAGPCNCPACTDGRAVDDEEGDDSVGHVGDLSGLDRGKLS